MKKEIETIGLIRVLWPLAIGLGLALALLWVVMPGTNAEAQSPTPGFSVEQATELRAQQPARAAQAVNPGFTLDLAYETVWGMVNPGDLVTVTRTTGSAAYGAAEADGVGFFWTPLWQSNGQPTDVVAGDTVEVYVNGALAATLSPLDITGQVDVLTDLVTGNVSGLATGTSVTVTLGGFGQMPTDVPQIVTPVDGSGNFTADFDGVADIGPHQMAQVQYRDTNGNTVQGYVYPSEVFQVISWNTVQGYATPGDLLTVTVFMTYPTDVAWEGQVTAQRPHGTYQASDYGFEYGEVVEVDLGGGTVISVAVDYMDIRPDAAADQITGQAPAGAQLRGYVWDGIDGFYDDGVAIANGSGNYTITFGVDLEARHTPYVAYIDAEGDEVGYFARPPSIRVYPWRNALYAEADRPHQPVTYTLDTGSGTFTEYAGCGGTNDCDEVGFDSVAPGHIITVELPDLTMTMTVPSVTLQADTANDGAFGDADLPGRLDVFARQWNGWLYPVHGTSITSTSSSPFAVTFPGFDVRDGINLWAWHYDANGHSTQIYRGDSQAYFEINPTYNGVGGVPPSANEPVTATLYAADGTPLASTSDDYDGNPWRFWLGDFQGYEFESGRWITVTSESGWEAGLQISDLTVEVDQHSEMIWGTGPKSLLFVEHEGRNGWDGRFVPVDDYALDRAFFGDDIQWWDWIATTYIGLGGNQVRASFQWPQVVTNYRMDGSNQVWGQNSIAGNTIYITVTDEFGGFVDAGTTYPGSGDQGPTSYRLDFPDGTIVPSNTVHVNFGNNFTYTTTVVSITAWANPDSDVVTATAPISSWVSMNASDPYDNWWESDWSYGSLQVGASGYVTFDLSVDGFDIIPGTNFNVHVEDTQYSFWLPAPELSINKWNTNGYARPNGVVVYGIDYWNNGNGVATDTLVVDTLPMSTTWAGDTSGVVPTIGVGGVITWNLGNVEAGDGGSFMVTLNVFGLSDGDTIDQNCTVITTTTPGDYDLGNNGPSCAGSVSVWDDEVEVGVDKWPSPSDPMPGQEFVYDIQPCNYRGAAAGPLWLTDTLPLSTTFVSLDSDRGDATYWTEVITSGGQLVLYTPGFPGDECENLHLRLLLDTAAAISTTLENTIVITAAGDVYPDNNGPHVNTNAHVSGPRYDMNTNKWYNNGVLAPGGWIRYGASYWNSGNIVTHAWITDVLPSGTSYRLGSGQNHRGEPFEPVEITADYVVWDVGVVPVNDGFGFDFTLDISDTLPVPTDLGNCVTVGITDTEDTPWDNTACVTVTVNASGPNLRVTKWHNWNGDGQLGYEVRFENIGDQTVSDVWVTDSLPISTTYEGWWNMDFDWSRLVSDTQSSSVLRWQFSDLYPGDSGWLYFNANLDTAGQPLRWYTNTVEITIPPTDVDPADNVYEDVAFSGGEVESVDLDVYRTRTWGCAYDTPITITSVLTQMVIDWDTCWDVEFGDTFDPGDVVTVAAGAGVHPVVIHVPDPFTAYASSITNTVWGQIGGATYESVDVDLWGFPGRRVQTDGSGNYSATFPDVPRGARGDVNYGTDIDYANVGFHRRFQTQDLILNVNYGHDWVNGNYEPSHTVWITVTESDSVTVKATAVLATGPIPEWGGDSGFETQWDDWSPNQPDIQAGDWVFGLVDNGQATQVRIGTITGTVDVDNDSIAGRIYAPWFTQTLDVRCDEWEGYGVSSKNSTAGPDGDPPYYCQWDSGTEWDVQPGEQIGVWYRGPDLNWVGNVFLEPQPYVRIEKSANGNPAVGGNLRFNIQYWNDGDYAENVVITDTLLGGMTYITDTSGVPHTGSGSGPIVWDLGTVDGYSGYSFDVFVAITAGQGDPITNTVEITTSSPYNQSGPGERYSEWNGTVQPNDTWLNLGKWIEGPNPAPGTDFDWRVQVCNEGSTASSEVTLTDTLPISTTLLSWWGDVAGWSEVLNTGDRLVLSYPSIPDGQCASAYLRFHLDEDAWIGMLISNTATITASNDLNGGSTVTDWRDIYGPFSNLYVRKDWLQGQLMPGGELIYGVQYGNDGNAPADDVWLTYTLPVSTTFSNAWWNDQYGQHPFPPDMITSDYVVWNLGTLENGFNSNFEVRLNVDDSASPGTVLTSTVEITPHPTDFHYDDNTVTWAEMLNDSGPNLAVHKQNYWWNGTGQIQYEMRVKNRGDERIAPVWITDTYPISTTWDGNWWYGHGPWVTTTHDVPNRQIVFWLEYLDPGETASIMFSVDLDGSIQGEQGLFFTNTLEAPLPGDVYPADNYDEVIAYAGPDVYAEKWLKSGEPRPGEIVTFTIKFGNRNSWNGMDGMWGSYITDTLPPEMTFITATAPWDPNQWWYPDGITGTTSVRWSPGTPWSNNNWYFAVVARVTDTVQSGDVITNVVEYWNDNPNDVDLSLDNNVFELPLTILNPVFEMDKVYEGDVAGTVVTYTLTVTNVGNYPGTNVILSDTVPAYLEDVGSSGTLNMGWIWWNLGTIGPDGDAATAWFSATLPCTASLSIVNDDYGVRSSDQGVSGPAGSPVSFAVVEPTISVGVVHTPGTIVVSDTVAFTATAGTDGTGLSYEWDLGDGAMSGGLTATQVYTQDGDYAVVFTATDACGYSEVATVTVTVNPPNLVASFDHSPDPANILVNGTVMFTDTSTTDVPPIVAWMWDFGDSSTPAFTQNASHVYDTVGTYTVTLVVTDALGYSDDEVKTNVVTVSLACTPVTSVTFAYAPLYPTIQSPVVFTATVTPSGATQPITYTWDFGDGVTSTVTIASTSHTYTTSGTMTVDVTAYNPCTPAGVSSAPTDIEIASRQIFLPLVLRNY